MAKISQPETRPEAAIGHWRGRVQDYGTALRAVVEKIEASSEPAISFHASYVRPDGATVHADSVDDLIGVLAEEPNPSSITYVNAAMYANGMDRVVNLHNGLGRGMTVNASSKEDDDIWATGIVTIAREAFAKQEVTEYQDAPRPLNMPERLAAGFIVVYLVYTVAALVLGYIKWTLALSSIEIAVLVLISLSVAPQQRRVQNPAFVLTDGLPEPDPPSRIRDLPRRAEVWLAAHPMTRFLLGVVLVGILVSQASDFISSKWLGK